MSTCPRPLVLASLPPPRARKIRLHTRLFSLANTHLETVDVDDSRGNLYVEHGEHRGGRLARELSVQPRVQSRTVVALDHRTQGGAEERVWLGVLRNKEQASRVRGVIEGRVREEGGGV